MNCQARKMPEKQHRTDYCGQILEIIFIPLKKAASHQGRIQQPPALTPFSLGINSVKSVHASME